jgi:hypothetical protein
MQVAKSNWQSSTLRESKHPSNLYLLRFSARRVDEGEHSSREKGDIQDMTTRSAAEQRFPIPRNQDEKLIGRERCSSSAVGDEYFSVPSSLSHTLQESIELPFPRNLISHNAYILISPWVWNMLMG